MERELYQDTLLDSIENISLFAKNYKLIERENINLKEQLNNKKKDISELKEQLRDKKSQVESLEKKYNNQQKRIEKIEEIYSTIPGTTKEDKNRYFEFLATKVLPEIIKEARSSTYKMVERHWSLNHNSIYKEIIPIAELQTFVIGISFYTFYTLCYNKSIVNEDTIIGLVTECFNINSEEGIYNIDTKKILNSNIVIDYANKVHSTEMILEIVNIANYYLDIFNLKSKKMKNKCEIVELYEYNELLYKELEKI